MIAFVQYASDLPELLWAGVSAETLLRLGLSVIAGTLVGIERERHGRAAGLRTQMLVCLAACIAMILSDEFYRRSIEREAIIGGWHPDPARLAAGVLAGMGFLGAGVILRQSTHVVRGVTTAATLWFVTITGMCFGAGAIGLGLIATVGSVVILGLFHYMETWIKNDWYSDLSVTFSPSACSVDRVVAELAPLGVKVKGVDIDEDVHGDHCRATFHLKYKRRGMIDFSDRLTAVVRKLPGVIRISLQS